MNKGTQVVLRTTNGGECFVKLTHEYRPTYAVTVERADGSYFTVLADRIASVTPVGAGMSPTTVYPTTQHGFPAVSFVELADALAYASAMTRTAPCGVCTCPAASYTIHQRDMKHG